LWLSFNNLRGELPPSLNELQSLKFMDVAGNQLTGDVPVRLLDLWDRHLFEFSGGRNAFTGFLTKAVVTTSSPGSVCSDTADTNFSVVFDEMTGRAKWESFRCSERNSRSYCVIREGTFDSLGRLSRELSHVNFRSFAARYDQPFTMTTHGSYLTTTAYWSDGSRHSVETYSREGPREVWMAQQLFLALLGDTYWDREYRTAACDFKRQTIAP
jgi:hypothetical protein